MTRFCKVSGCVAIFHFNGLLRDDLRRRLPLRIQNASVANRNPLPFASAAHARADRRSLSAEGGDERGMYVDNAVFKMAAEAVRQDGHEACEHDQTDVCVLQQSGKRLAVLFRVGKVPAAQHLGGNSRFCGTLECIRLRLDETTSEICPFSILPACCASMSACRFVPPPETKTAILSFIFLQKTNEMENCGFVQNAIIQHIALH